MSVRLHHSYRTTPITHRIFHEMPKGAPWSGKAGDLSAEAAEYADSNPEVLQNTEREAMKAKTRDELRLSAKDLEVFDRIMKKAPEQASVKTTANKENPITVTKENGRNGLYALWRDKGDLALVKNWDAEIRDLSVKTVSAYQPKIHSIEPGDKTWVENGMGYVERAGVLIYQNVPLLPWGLKETGTTTQGSTETDAANNTSKETTENKPGENSEVKTRIEYIRGQPKVMEYLEKVVEEKRNKVEAGVAEPFYFAEGKIWFQGGAKGAEGNTEVPTHPNDANKPETLKALTALLNEKWKEAPTKNNLEKRGPNETSQLIGGLIFAKSLVLINKNIGEIYDEMEKVPNQNPFYLRGQTLYMKNVRTEVAIATIPDIIKDNEPYKSYLPGLFNRWHEAARKARYIPKAPPAATASIEKKPAHGIEDAEVDGVFEQLRLVRGQEDATMPVRRFYLDSSKQIRYQLDPSRQGDTDPKIDTENAEGGGFVGSQMDVDRLNTALATTGSVENIMESHTMPADPEVKTERGWIAVEANGQKGAWNEALFDQKVKPVTGLKWEKFKQIFENTTHQKNQTIEFNKFSWKEGKLTLSDKEGTNKVSINMAQYPDAFDQQKVMDEYGILTKEKFNRMSIAKEMSWEQLIWNLPLEKRAELTKGAYAHVLFNKDANDDNVSVTLVPSWNSEETIGLNYAQTVRYADQFPGWKLLTQQEVGQLKKVDPGSKLAGWVVWSEKMDASTALLLPGTLPVEKEDVATEGTRLVERIKFNPKANN